MSDQGKLQIRIINKLGLHARAASKLVATASRFQSRIELYKGSQKADAKSIMSVLMLAASQGTLLDIHVTGKDWEEAMQGVSDLINNRFDEAE